MPEETRAEIVFEHFCKKNSIRCEPIPTDAKRAPDYYIWLGDQKIVAEIKQIDPGEEDLAECRDIKDGKFRVGSTIPGERIRQKINKASKQIIAGTKKQFPSILIIYNNLPFFSWCYTEPYDFLVAMYGLESIVLSKPKDYSKKPEIIDARFGPRRKLTKNQNTSFSALALLSEDEAGNPLLKVYHNIYADIPINPGLLKRINAEQYSIDGNQAGTFQDWIPL